jgi:hypothetical protein
MLWNNSHESWSDFFDRCDAQARNKEGLSKEAAADKIVGIHNENGGPAKTGQHFNPASVTEANRLKANAMSLDRAKEKDLFNVAPYVTASWPEEVKLAYWAQYLRVAGLTVQLASTEEHDGLCLESVCDLQISAGDAFKALTEAIKNPTASNLDHAEREAVKAGEKFKRTRAFIAKARQACTKTKEAIGRMAHRTAA